MYTKEDILKQLDVFKEAKGKPVIVHSSLKAVGEVEGRGEGLLSVLTDYFAKDDGVLCVPTHTWTEDYMDLRKNESCIGRFPTIAAGYDGGVRSMHPTHSMTVFGNRAEEFINGEENADTPTSPEGCYGKLYKEGGYILLMGVGQEKNTYIHCVEEMLDTPGRLTDHKVKKGIIHKDGSVNDRYIYWFDTRKIPDVSKNFGKFEAAFRYHECIVDGVIGNAKTQLCDAVKIKEIIEMIYKRSGGAELLADSSPLDEILYK